MGLTKDAQELSRTGLHLTGVDKNKQTNNEQKTPPELEGRKCVGLGGCKGPLVESEPEIGVKREKVARFDLTVLTQCERL